MRLQIRVYGRPAPQGSKRHVGGGRMVEMSKYVQPWRNDVFAAAVTAMQSHPSDVRAHRDRAMFTGPVRMAVVFTIARPKGHYRTGQFAHLLKPAAPAYPAVAPDLSKLIRSTEDALTVARVWTDDALVVRHDVAKVYIGEPSGLDRPGALITITEVSA